MFIQNGTIFTKEGVFKQGNIWIEKDKIRKIEYDTPSDTEHMQEKVDATSVNATGIDVTRIDATGMYVIPGLIDIHFHGCMGYDICDGTFTALEAIEAYQLKNGVTSLFPATMTLQEEELRSVFRVAGEYIERQSTAVLGITMEGPFLSKAKKGAQAEQHIKKPDMALFRELQKLSGGHICQVAVAPEEDENFRFISEASKEVTVSVAHTVADYDTAKQAFEQGATHVTHLLNGMPPFLHRDPGVVGAAYDNSKVCVELICDGVHIHPAMVRAIFELFGSERICMISDSMRATGMPEGEYTLGGQKVWVKENVATLEDGTIAGGICNLYQCFKKAVLEMNIPLKDAIWSCTQTPAKALGIEDKVGSIEEGKNADLLILDKNLNIKYVIKNGRQK